MSRAEWVKKNQGDLTKVTLRKTLKSKRRGLLIRHPASRLLTRSM
jgi:hypothetical protein